MAKKNIKRLRFCEICGMRTIHNKGKEGSLICIQCGNKIKKQENEIKTK